MNTLDKSLLALDNLLENISKEEMDRIVAEIDGMSATGPTVFEYLEEFENQYQVIYNDNDCWVIDSTPDLNTLNYSEPIQMQEQVVELKHNRKPIFDIVIEPISIYSLNDFQIAA